VLPKIGAAFGDASKTPVQIRFSFAASGTIERQISAGAPIDVFVAAGDKEIDDLTKTNALVVGTRTVFATNRLVLIQPKGAERLLNDFASLPSLPDGSHIVMGNPDTVPAGRYAKEVLTKCGVWDTLVTRNLLVFVGSVRQALDAADSQNADAALVFATDARVELSRVRVDAVAVPVRDHDPIRYVAAVTQQAQDKDTATAFVAFLAGKAASRILDDAGFLPPK
jgi:molybdate transport system substrate-binding protein